MNTNPKFISSEPRPGVELVQSVVVMALLKEGRVGSPREVALVVQEVEDAHRLLA